MRNWWTTLYNPILIKEYRTRMRSWKALLLMTLYVAVLGIGTFGYMYFNNWSDYLDPRQSRSVFITLSILQLVLIGFVAPGLTAGTIAGERERQTLNILLTTHLSPLNIVVSKLVSSLSFLTLLVFSTLPVYVIVFLYGGISPVQVIGVFGYYLMAMILFGSLGLFCSAWFKRTGVSTVMVYGIILFILGGTILLAGLYSEYLNRKYMFTAPNQAHAELFFVSALNPIMNLNSLFNSNALTMGRSVVIDYPIRPWLYFLVVYMPLSAVLIAWSVRLVMPVKTKRFRK